MLNDLEEYLEEMEEGMQMQLRTQIQMETQMQMERTMEMTKSLFLKLRGVFAVSKLTIVIYQKLSMVM